MLIQFCSRIVSAIMFINALYRIQVVANNSGLEQNKFIFYLNYASIITQVLFVVIITIFYITTFFVEDSEFLNDGIGVLGVVNAVSILLSQMIKSYLFACYSQHYDF